ncbi:unnamed protein product [Bursaphelenchus okinawaensis]|uniref:Uncharacterized protein n=1 Tax=Bursaphelenchus okinawaensis TaxID=465554 RepID=A0A811L9P3_9BILA|nr:unnamed protein product [Bursaphelenchus okinawaensis]CAG9120341.1 unnamed protein product [Bursaphelenchus okinawaensis]
MNKFQIVRCFSHCSWIGRQFNVNNKDRFGLLNKRIPHVEKLKTVEQVKKPGRVIDDTAAFLGFKDSDDVPTIQVPKSKEKKKFYGEQYYGNKKKQLKPAKVSFNTKDVNKT